MTAPPEWVQHALAPSDSDSPDLRWALETAAALWSRGDHLQGVRWIQHAVQAAHADGRQDRAATLGRAMAELERMTHAPTDPSPTPPPSPPAPPPVSAGSVSMSMKKTAPYKVALDDITRMVSPDPLLVEQTRPPMDTSPDAEGPASDDTMKEARPRPPPPSIDPESTMTSVRSKKAAERTMVMEFDQEALAALEEQSGVIATPREAEAPPSEVSKQISSIPNTVESPHAPLETLRAVRVAVIRGQGNQIDVTLLGEGESAPVGAQEALLVPLGPVREG